MKERDESSSGATPRHCVNEPVPVSFSFRQGLSDVVDSKCDVVDPFTSFREGAADRTVPQGFQKLQMKIPRIKKSDPHAVTYEFISLADRKAEQLAICRNSFIQTADRNPDVVNAHGSSSSCAAAVYGSNSPR